MLVLAPAFRKNRPMPVERIRSDIWALIGQRVRERREAAGLSQPRLAALLPWGDAAQQKLSRIEIGATKLIWTDAENLAAALGCAPLAFFVEGGADVPLLYRVGIHRAKDDDPAFAAPQERVQPPRSLHRPEECFAAEQVDDTAIGLNYPEGTTYFVRRATAIAGGPQLGDRVLVARHIRRAGERRLYQVLCGTLETTTAGDYLVLPMSADPEVPPAVVVRARPRPPGLADALAPYTVGPSSMQPENEAELLGRIEAATVPQRRAQS